MSHVWCPPPCHPTEPFLKWLGKERTIWNRLNKLHIFMNYLEGSPNAAIKSLISGFRGTQRYVLADLIVSDTPSQVAAQRNGE